MDKPVFPSQADRFCHKKQTPTAVAEVIGLHPKTFKRMIKRKQFKPVCFLEAGEKTLVDVPLMILHHRKWFPVWFLKDITVISDKTDKLKIDASSRV